MYVVIIHRSGKTFTRELKIYKDAIVRYMNRGSLFIKGYVLTNAI